MTTFLATGSAFLNGTVLIGRTFRGDPIFELSVLNRAGYLPVISTLSGAARICFGAIHSIVHLAAAIFDFKNTEYHIYQVHIGIVSGILRGALEMLPVLGNSILMNLDSGFIYKNMKQDFIRKFPSYDLNWDRQNVYDSLFIAAFDGSSKFSRGLIKI